MSVTIKTKWVVLAIAIAIVGVFFSGWYLGRQAFNRVLNHTEDSLKHKIDSMYIILKERSFYAYEVEQEVKTLKQAIKEGLVEKQALKALNLRYVSEVTQLRGQVRILADSIANTGDVIVITDCDTTTKDTAKAIKLPFSFGKIDKFYQLSGGFDLNGQMNVRLAVPMELDIISGWNKKTKQYNAAALSSNPYVIFNGINSFKMGLTKPKKIGIGLNVGYGVILKSNPELRPYIGVGVSYNLIRF